MKEREKVDNERGRRGWSGKIYVRKRTGALSDMTEEGRPTLSVFEYTVIKQSKLVGGEGLRIRLLKSQLYLFGEHIFHSSRAILLK